MSVRHQCLIYEGCPSGHLETIAACIKRQLDRNYRCLYMNSEPMVELLSSYLAAVGVDADEELYRKRLLLISKPKHLGKNHVFSIERMFNQLERLMDETLRIDFSGLFGSGDIGWEFGPRKDFSKLFEYEWRLERFLGEHPQMEGMCQYHVDTLPQEAVRTAAIAHETIFIDEKLSVANPNYIGASRGTRGKDQQFTQ
jgi:hypothetical protein